MKSREDKHLGNRHSTASQLMGSNKKHEAALVQLGYYKKLVEAIQDYAIFLMDSEGYIISWNKGAELTKGYKPAEIIGKHFSTFYLQEDIDAKKPEHELRVAKKFGRVEDEDWRVRKDGSKFWANVIITALYEDDGTLVGFAKVTRDLTERKQHEDMLRRANTLLKEQQRELQRLNMSKDEFISLASHQLRTPATAIKQLLGLLLEGFKGDILPEHREILQKAYESNERQINIVNSLLKVAQIDAGKVTLRKVLTDTQAVLLDVVESYKNAFTKRKQMVITAFDETVPLALLDQDYFRMALENIIDNATKYTPTAGVINVAVKQQNDCVAVVVKDSGVGIAKQDIPKLFGKFTRIPNELSDNVGGSGLGLYWVNKVIALHNGYIEVKSKPGYGTTFKILLPIGEKNA